MAVALRARVSQDRLKSEQGPRLAKPTLTQIQKVGQEHPVLCASWQLQSLQAGSDLHAGCLHIWDPLQSPRHWFLSPEGDSSTGI